MYEILSRSEGPLVGIRLSGLIRREEAEAVLEHLAQLMTTHDQINLLLLLDRLQGWDKDAGKAHSRFGWRHAQKFRRVAVVAHTKWRDFFVEADSVAAFQLGVEERFFESEEIENAWEWLQS